MVSNEDPGNITEQIKASSTPLTSPGPSLGILRSGEGAERLGG